MYGGQRLGALTVSAGVAQADEHRSNPSDLLRAADETLYNAKILGVTACDSLPSEKNRFEAAERAYAFISLRPVEVLSCI